MRIRAAIIALLLLPPTACVSSPRRRVAMNAPNANGCYVKVYDGERYQGTADFINGPDRYATLNRLPNDARWGKRIRSAQVGPAATVTIWTDADFEGSSMQMSTDRAFPVLAKDFAGQIESMAVACTAAAYGPAA